MTQTATNPQTGETVALVGNEWKPVIQTATNKAGEKAYLVDNQWITGNSAVSPAQNPTTAPQSNQKNGFVDQPSKGTRPSRYKAGTMLYPNEESYLREAVAKAASGPASGLVQQLFSSTQNAANSDVAKKLADLMGMENTRKLAAEDLGSVSARIAQTAREGGDNLLGSFLQPELWLTGKATGNFIGNGANFATKALRAGLVTAPYGAASALSNPSDSAFADRAIAGVKTGAAGAAGSLIGSAISGTANAIGKLGATDRARRAMESIIGKGDMPKAQQLAEQAIGKDVSSVQALSELDNPALAALGDVSRGSSAKSAKFYTDMASRQKAEGLAPLEKMARGTSSEESIAARKLMKDKLEEALGPVRENMLKAANTAGQFNKVIDPLIAQKEASKIAALQDTGRLFALEGQTRNALNNKINSPTPGWVNPNTTAMIEDNVLKARAGTQEMNAMKWQRQDESAFLQMQKDSLAKHGLHPLDLSPIKNNLDSMMNTPGIRASGKVQSVLGTLSDKFNEAIKAGGGIPDARDIYEIRKSGINEIVDTLTAGQDPKTSSKLAAKLTAKIRPMIDDAITNAGGTEWKSYITQYSKGLEAVDRVELLDKARQLYLNSPKKFIDLVKGESPKVVQKIMSGNYSINDVLSSNRMDSLTEIMANISRDARLKQLAPLGQGALQNELAAKGLSAHLPNFLWRPAMVANAALKTVEANKNSEMWKILDKATQNPQKMSELLNQLPVEQRNMVLQFISKGSKAIPFAATGLVPETQ